METLTLKSIFESNKEELSSNLEKLSLPKDSELVQKTVADFLGDLFESEGVYRQNLTQSEDYILQAAMSLLNAQQSMIGEFIIPETNESVENKEEKKKLGAQPVVDAKRSLNENHYPYVVGGTAVGGAAGALIFGTWGAVFGAIAGTALVLYCSSQFSPKESKALPQEELATNKIVKEQKINVEVFTKIVGCICDSVDTLIQTFRAQINRVVDKYENIEKPSLETDYLDLIENIQGLLGAYEMDSSNEIRNKRLEQRIQLLSESLENYNLQSIRYDGNNKDLFNFQPSTNVEKDTMVLPAIVKENKTIIKGKVFTKE